jgi:serine/threonine protein kinase
MEELGATEYRIKSECTAGPIGVRYVIESQLTGDELLADIVFPDDAPCLAAVCQNALRTKRWTTDSAVANVLETGWQKDGSYFQVLEMTPLALPLSDLRSRPDEPQLWVLAKSLVAGLRHLHRRELVHGAVAPQSIYQDDDKLRLAELWFAHDADGHSLYSELANYFSASPPDFVVPFMAPEVLCGESPRRESDIFGLGAVLFQLLTGQTPRDFESTYSGQAAREALASTPVTLLYDMRPDLSDAALGLVMSMLDADPAERPTIFLLEQACTELIGVRTPEDEAQEIQLLFGP